MTLFNLEFDKVLTRYYLMMILVLLAFFVGLPYLALTAVPVFISTLLGIKFSSVHQERTPILKNSISEYNADNNEKDLAKSLAY